MKRKLRLGLLIFLAVGAIFAGAEAYRSLRPVVSDTVPQEVYARFEANAGDAEYYLGSCEGYVAVYRERRDKAPMTVTTIEVSELRLADRAMIEKGIPVLDREELLYLLEDLGS